MPAASSPPAEERVEAFLIKVVKVHTIAVFSSIETTVAAMAAFRLWV